VQLPTGVAAAVRGVVAGMLVLFLSFFNGLVVMPHPITVELNPTGSQTIRDAHFEPAVMKGAGVV